jgi:hypothetical protein
MGFNALIAWRKEMVRQLRTRAEGRMTDPDSWDGYEADPWWREQREKRDRELGR